MNIKERYRRTIEYFKENQPAPKTELTYSDPFELLVAVILSAQCTDKRVNLVTPALLEAYPDAEKMSRAGREKILSYIKSCSYPNSKAAYLSEMSKMLIEKFGGVVPGDPGQLQLLPGVGRKTANVVASVIYDLPVMPVDTHVFRVSVRIGLSPEAKNPEDVEKILTRNIPGNLMHDAHHWLILHGRYVCKARNPLCNECGLRDFCRYYSQGKRIKRNLKKNI